jgi:hypothetical protein
MSATDFPCGSCGAEVGAKCEPDCPGLGDGEWDFGDVSEYVNQPIEEYGPRSVDESLSIIAEHVHLLPFGNLVGVRGMGAPDRGDYEVGEYLARLADWMAEYQPLLRAMVDDLTAQSRQRISLQLERDVLDGVIRRALEGAPA